MKKDISENIKKYIEENKQVSSYEIEKVLNLNEKVVKNQLKKLLDKGNIYKIGKPPKIFYSPKNENEKIALVEINEKLKNTIEKSYLIITPSGEKKEGLEGFIYWCKKNNLDIQKTAEEYINTLKKYEKYKDNGLILGSKKLKNTFQKTYLNEIYYLDFYSIERFGKTKLGQLLLYGKQSGNAKIIKEIIQIMRPNIEKIIKKNKINAIGFIPWTIKRNIQFLNELKKGLDLKIPQIQIDKVKTEIAVPQKTLNKIEDRIENANKTIVVTKENYFENILLIDDAIGSGATLNETAKKIKDKKIAKKVYGVCITGSFKGFDVINEV